MSAWNRALVVVLSSSLMLVTASLSAQDPENQEETGTPEPSPAVRVSARRLPDYFGMIGLSQTQKEKIYQVREQRLGEIEVLERKIQEIKDGIVADCEKVLTQTQLQLLQEIRERKAGR